MAALTADISRTFHDAAPVYREYLMKASTTIYQGSLVCVDTNGVALPAADTSGYLFVGIADEQVTSAASGNYYIRVRNGDVTLPAVSIAQGHVGDPMYVVDSSSVDDSAGVSNNVVCGVLTRYISATSGWICTTDVTSVTAVGTSTTFADGSTLVHEAALAATDVDTALEELHAEFDDHICEDGAGATTVSPGTNREHFAGAINGKGCGIAYRVLDDGSGIAAKTVVRPTGYTSGIPDVIQSVGTTGAAPACLYCPTAITAAAQGWAYKVYTQENCGVNTSGSAVGNPVYRSATGTLTLTRLTGSNRNQVVGRVLTLAADGEVQIDFDDEIVFPHEHTDESEGGEVGGIVSFFFDATWTKDGTDQTLIMPAMELPYAVTVKRCYASVDTAPGATKTLTVDLNTTLCATVTTTATTGEDESLAIAIAADTDWAITVNETAGGSAADLHLVFYYVKSAV